ncbi:hypothetical protein FHS29_006236 [Saccharothrix tamanrassetensis]|uniref:Ricin B lectin domain-containing protein n=1 Tax=Saccharothrix tamanrassetensis TaxID=1051531 RepID=A0A841CUJ2_9PSEU|nr:RICIN domain-containing protein [Saccharothrix tamanrassetensis]MBB5959615.1 hypothetical protein [Saccharothrix tamanrassetensis]
MGTRFRILAAVVAGILSTTGLAVTAQAAPVAETFTFDAAQQTTEPVRQQDGTVRTMGVFGPFNVRAAHSDKCLEVLGGTGATGNGVQVQQWACMGPAQTNQHWYFTDSGDGYTYYVTARHSAKCLGVRGGTGATGNGVDVQQSQCVAYSQSNQRWQLFTQDRGATLLVVAQHSRKCLDVRGGTGATWNGAQVQQWQCMAANTQTNQRWYLTTV